jgi:hypothetical protein
MNLSCLLSVWLAVVVDFLWSSGILCLLPGNARRRLILSKDRPSIFTRGIERRGKVSEPAIEDCLDYLRTAGTFGVTVGRVRWAVGGGPWAVGRDPHAPEQIMRLQPAVNSAANPVVTMTMIHQARARARARGRALSMTGDWGFGGATNHNSAHPRIPHKPITVTITIAITITITIAITITVNQFWYSSRRIRRCVSETGPCRRTGSVLAL